MTTPYGVKSMRSQASYWAAQVLSFSLFVLQLQVKSVVKRNDVINVMPPGCEWQMAYLPKFKQVFAVCLCKQFAEMVMHARAREQDVLIASNV